MHHALTKLTGSNGHEYESFVRFLLSKGARLDVKNNEGKTPFDLLLDYVDEYSITKKVERLSYVSALLNDCENKDVLRELKYKDVTPALDKLNELRIKCRNTSIIAASTLTIVGVALGVAIAVYPGMLAVGIAVGACCLVVAAITYYCSSPANLLKDSNAEVVINQTSVAEL